MALMDAGAFLRQIASTVGGGFRQLDHEIDGMAAYWGGPAAASFSAGWQEAYIDENGKVIVELAPLP